MRLCQRETMIFPLISLGKLPVHSLFTFNNLSLLNAVSKYVYDFEVFFLYITVKIMYLFIDLLLKKCTFDVKTPESVHFLCLVFHRFLGFFARLQIPIIS